MVRTFWLCAAIAVLGCDEGVHIQVDGGLSDAAVREMRSLELVSEPRLALREGDSATIAVSLRDALGPLPGETVRFALDGTANDSSLDSLEGTTDAEGVGRVDLHAGAIASAFRVRISADDAAPIFVTVGVSDRGFGRLQVEAVYDGEREG